MDGRQERINLKLYYDGNIYDGLFKNITDKGSVHDALIKQNQLFLQHEIEQIQAEKFSKVIIGNGTIAQDKFAYTDLEPGTQNALRLAALPVIQSYLNKNVTADVVFDPFWMSDIYGGKAAGDSYHAALKEYYSGSKPEQHSRAVIDHSRVSIIYSWAHRTAALNPEAKEIVIDYYYDMIPRLGSLNNFFDRRQLMLPNNVLLRLHHFDRNSISQHLQMAIPGRGNTDKHYEWSVRYLESQHYACFGRMPGNNRNIQTANELASYHFADNVYHGNDRKGTMEIPDTFQTEKFLHFREKEIIANLGDVNMLGHKVNYTTAGELCREGCLPAKLVLDAGVNKHPAPPLITAQPIPTGTGTQPAPTGTSAQPAPTRTSAQPAPISESMTDSPVTPAPVSVPDTFIDGLQLIPDKYDNEPSDFIIEDPVDSAQATFQLEPVPPSRSIDAAAENDTDDTNQLMVLDASDTSEDLPAHDLLVQHSGHVNHFSQSDNQKAALDYIHGLYKLYANTSLNDNFSITTFIRTLCNASQVHKLSIPRDFNPLEAIKDIARLTFWNTIGSSFNYFSGKVPDGITEISSRNPNSLAELVKLLKEHLDKASTSYFHGRRQPVTTDFYDMILTLCEDRMDDQIRYVAVNAFINKWKITGFKLQVDLISPEPLPVARCD